MPYKLYITLDITHNLQTHQLFINNEIGNVIKDKWCPGAEFDAYLKRQFVTESTNINSLADHHIWSTIKTLPATLPEPMFVIQ